VSLDLTLDAGSGSCDFDLTGLQVSDLFLDVGSGTVDLTLPSGSTFDARIDGGSGRLTIVLHQSVGAWVVLDSGSGSFRLGERFRLVEGERHDDSVWETDSFDTAEHTIVLTIFHSLLGGYAPTCYVIPLAATLFAVAALRGIRTRWSAGLVGVLLAVTVFIVVGNPLFGFPWQGCVG
jgi:hypothetical protein